MDKVHSQKTQVVIRIVVVVQMENLHSFPMMTVESFSRFSHMRPCAAKPRRISMTTSLQKMEKFMQSRNMEKRMDKTFYRRSVGRSFYENRGSPRPGAGSGEVDSCTVFYSVLLRVAPRCEIGPPCSITLRYFGTLAVAGTMDPDPQ